ncbi:unnamed protein product [Dicrocoelium dendriticum]|nr:unnamed protein product [Dicrocoelium dendriticum]
MVYKTRSDHVARGTQDTMAAMFQKFAICVFVCYLTYIKPGICTTLTTRNSCRLSFVGKENGTMIGYSNKSNFDVEGFCNYAMEVREGNQVNLTFENVTLEREGVSLKDYIVIFDGPDCMSRRIRAVHDQQTPRFISSGNRMAALFISNSQSETVGFKARFYTVTSQNASKPLPPKGRNLILWNCGGNLTNETGSLSFNKTSLQNALCIWRITVAVDKLVELHIEKLELQTLSSSFRVLDGNDCAADVIYYHRSYDAAGPLSINSTSNVMVVVLAAPLGLSFAEVKASYKSVPNRNFTNTTTPIETTVTTTTVGVISSSPSSEQPENEITSPVSSSTTEQPETSTSSGDIIATTEISTRNSCHVSFVGKENGTMIGYANKSNFDVKGFCNYAMEVSEGNQVNLTFEIVKLEREGISLKDYIVIFDGPDCMSRRIRAVHDQQTPRFISSGNRMAALFISNSQSETVGFKARFYTVTAQNATKPLPPKGRNLILWNCGGNLTNETGSLSFNKTSLQNALCIWRITVAVDKLVELHIEKLELQTLSSSFRVLDGNDCAADVIYYHRSYDAAGPLSINSTSNVMVVVLAAPLGLSFAEVKASYKSVPNPNFTNTTTPIETSVATTSEEDEKVVTSPTLNPATGAATAHTSLTLAYACNLFTMFLWTFISAIHMSPA